MYGLHIVLLYFSIALAVLLCLEDAAFKQTGHQATEEFRNNLSQQKVLGGWEGGVAVNLRASCRGRVTAPPFPPVGTNTSCTRGATTSLSPSAPSRQWRRQAGASASCTATHTGAARTRDVLGRYAVGSSWPANCP
jgi:hypothetical protein